MHHDRSFTETSAGMRSSDDRLGRLRAIRLAAGHHARARAAARRSRRARSRRSRRARCSPRCRTLYALARSSRAVRRGAVRPWAAGRTRSVAPIEYRRSAGRHDRAARRATRPAIALNSVRDLATTDALRPTRTSSSSRRRTGPAVRTCRRRRARRHERPRVRTRPQRALRVVVGFDAFVLVGRRLDHLPVVDAAPAQQRRHARRVRADLGRARPALAELDAQALRTIGT